MDTLTVLLELLLWAAPAALLVTLIVGLVQRHKPAITTALVVIAVPIAAFLVSPMFSDVSPGGWFNDPRSKFLLTVLFFAMIGSVLSPLSLLVGRRRTEGVIPMPQPFYPPEQYPYAPPPPPDRRPDHWV